VNAGNRGADVGHHFVEAVGRGAATFEGVSHCEMAVLVAGDCV